MSSYPRSMLSGMVLVPEQELAAIFAYLGIGATGYSINNRFISAAS